MVRIISDGTTTAAIAPSISDSGVDLYAGIGGAPEAVLAAAGLWCLGGDMQTMMWPRGLDEEKKVVELGFCEGLKRVFYAEDLARGKKIIFFGTGIDDTPLFGGVGLQ